jgi:hypothetical protein
MTTGRQPESGTTDQQRSDRQDLNRSAGDQQRVEGAAERRQIDGGSDGGGTIERARPDRSRTESLYSAGSRICVPRSEADDVGWE